MRLRLTWDLGDTSCVCNSLAELWGVAGLLLQEAKERPNFAEIIQVLRQLLADEARRAPSTSPGEQARRARLHPATSGSGDSRQAQQVLHRLLSCHTSCLFPAGARRRVVVLAIRMGRRQAPGSC